MIKLFAWESKMLEQLVQKRDEELKYILRGKLLDLLSYIMDVSIPIVSSVLTLGAYVRTDGAFLTETLLM